MDTDTHSGSFCRRNPTVSQASAATTGSDEVAGGEDEPQALLGRGIAHVGGADAPPEQPGCLAAGPAEPAALLTVFAEHPKSPSALALGLLPAAEPASAFPPPEDGNRLLSMEPAAAPQRPSPRLWLARSAPSCPALSHPPLPRTPPLTSSSLPLLLGLRKMRNWWCWRWTGHLEPPAGRAGC